MKASAYYFMLSLCILFASCKTEHRQADNSPRKIEILFLGHHSEHHNSEQFMPMLAAALAPEGINFTYTENPADLNTSNLGKYDGLLIYANHETITPDEEDALMDFVASGKGFIPVHCASFCFQNSQKYIDLVGGQFLRHDTGTFVAKIIKPDHPAMLGVKEFSTWDETYVHTKLTNDRTVLMERVEGNHHEPWTWVKTHGDGRVFYTAYGHDERTWDNPGFHNLMAAGIVWAVGDQVKKQWQAYMNNMPELQYVDKSGIPNYEQRVPAPRFQLPLSAEKSAKLIQVPVGFKLELFASEPDIINPIAMDWDERGRLWVIETVDYPNSVRNEDGVGDDRIKICEDTDGDGKADKFTVFADHLNIPTSLTFANGGIVVSQAPHFLFLKDTNGDDKADVRKEIITGWGTFDTHAGPSNLKYGMDNNIWGVLGYSGFKGTIAGQQREFSQGVYKFKLADHAMHQHASAASNSMSTSTSTESSSPQVTEFDYMTRTSNNTWGLGFTEDFEVFASTANNTHSVYLGIPDKYLQHVDGLPTGGSAKIDGHYGMMPIAKHLRQVDVWGGFTAAAGHDFYTARNYPEEYWNKIAFVCEPTGHVVHRALIEKEGAGYAEKNGGNLFAGSDEWVAPVEAKVGPDGAVWVADWYNFIIQHNPTPTPERGGFEGETGEGNAYVNPLRDREHGRIWRVVYKDAEPYEPMSLSADEPDGLIAALSSDNMFWRTTAQRLLVERNQKDVVPELYKIIKRDDTDDLGMSPAAIHALWTLHGLGMLDGKDEEAYRVVVQALHHPAAGVRRAAVQVMPDTRWANQAILQSGILQDKDPQTQLTATLATAEMPASGGLGSKLFQMSEQPEVEQDAWLSKAVYTAAIKHKDGFMDAYLKAHPQYEAMRAEQASMLSRQDIAYKDSQWKIMALPKFLEQANLDINGVVWFRKTIDLPARVAGKTGKISLGPIDETDEVWINGIRVGGIKDDYEVERIYDIPTDVLKAGQNLVVVRLEDTQGWGGFAGKPEQMFLQTSGQKTSLAGNWKYQVEKEYKEGASSFEGTTLADALMDTYWNRPAQQATAVAAVSDKDEQVVHIQTVKNAMKYDVGEFSVEAGKPVKIVFDNPDFMQHNLVIGQQGKLEVIGAAADAIATDPQGAEKNYVPDIPEVLYSTPLIDPQGSVELSFIAPDKPGEYPFVCTFPGHWRVMQGTMKVTGSDAI